MCLHRLRTLFVDWGLKMKKSFLMFSICLFIIFTTTKITFAERSLDMGLTLYSGFNGPVGEKKVFGTNPMFGLGFSTGILNKGTNDIMWELAFKIQINSNSEKFEYYAKGETHITSSDTKVYPGLYAHYHLLRKDLWSRKTFLMARVGLGFERVGTDIIKKSKKNNNEMNTDEYYITGSIHASIGLSYHIPLSFNNDYLGVALEYHYSPYHWDDDLKTEFNNSYYSFNLFYRI